MLILRHYQDVPESLRGAVVAIGNFDGIHRGHQEVIGKAARLAKEFDAPLAVLTFEPHPRAYFKSDQPPFRLTPFRTKARLIEALGVDGLFVLAFDQALAGLSAETFVTDVLTQGLGVRYVVVGDNFHFGHKRQGDFALLEKLGRQNGFGASCVDRVMNQQAEVYSSTLVRDYLVAGNPTRAALLLGRYWEIEGRVQGGDQRGRDLGYRTANIALTDTLVPAYGVYAVSAGIDRDQETVWYDGVANLGIRPMFEVAEPLLEAHLFDFDEAIYGEHVRVALVDYLRPEMNFETLDELRVQMDEDSRRARATLELEQWDASWPGSPFIAGSGESGDGDG